MRFFFAIFIIKLSFASILVADDCISADYSRADWSKKDTVNSIAYDDEVGNSGAIWLGNKIIIPKYLVNEKIDLFDITGTCILKDLKHRNLSESFSEIELTQNEVKKLNSGVYFLQINSKNNIIHLKLLIQK